MTCTQGTDMSSRCISLRDPAESFNEYKGCGRINELLQLAYDAIQHANYEAEKLPPSGNGFKRRFTLYAEDDVDEYYERTRRNKFREEVKRRGGYTVAPHFSDYKSDDDFEEGEVAADELYRPAFSPVQFYVEGGSYTPDHTPPASPREEYYSPEGSPSLPCYSPHDPDAE